MRGLGQLGAEIGLALHTRVLCQRREEVETQWGRKVRDDEVEKGEGSALGLRGAI